MPPRATYEISYALYVDGQDSGIELVGSSKSDAYKDLADQWYAYKRDGPPPPKRRCKLVEIERVRWG